jgi:hypothetical protein
MIRLRKATGEVLESEQDWGFVELCDTQGNLAFVLYKDGPSYRLFGKKDPEAQRYAKLFGLVFSDQKELVV